MIPLLKLFGNEIIKELKITLTYKFQWFGELLAISIYYFYLSHANFTTHFSIDGYFIWFYSIILIGDLGGKIANEMKMGTFEQNYLSVFSLKTLFAAKLSASLIRATAILLVLQILFYTSSNNFVSIQAFFVLLLLLPSLIGIAFFLAGLTVLFKEIGWLSNILNNSLLFLSGIFISMELFPIWIHNFSLLFPTTLAKLILSSSSILEFPLKIYLLQSLLYPLLGSLVLIFSERQARKSGAISNY
jgi:hypothetical protein